MACYAWQLVLMFGTLGGYFAVLKAFLAERKLGRDGAWRGRHGYWQMVRAIAGLVFAWAPFCSWVGCGEGLRKGDYVIMVPAAVCLAITAAELAYWKRSRTPDLDVRKRRESAWISAVFALAQTLSLAVAAYVSSAFFGTQSILFLLSFRSV